MAREEQRAGENGEKSKGKHDWKHPDDAPELHVHDCGVVTGAGVGAGHCKKEEEDRGEGNEEVKSGWYRLKTLSVQAVSGDGHGGPLAAVEDAEGASTGVGLRHNIWVTLENIDRIGK